MTYEASEVLIDDREPNALNYRKGLRHNGISADIKRLNVGDFLWHLHETATDTSYTVVVERKTTSDFVNSVQDGRLERFISASKDEVESSFAKGDVASAAVYRFILLERANLRLVKSGFGWTDDGLDNALLEAQMRGIYVVTCGGGEVVRRFTSLYTWLLKSRHDALTRLALPDISNGYLDESLKRQVRFLMGLPGIGEDKASAILANASSLRDVLGAIMRRDYASLTKARGVGKGSVDNMADFLE